MYKILQFSNDIFVPSHHSTITCLNSLNVTKSASIVSFSVDKQLRFMLAIQSMASLLFQTWYCYWLGSKFFYKSFDLFARIQNKRERANAHHTFERTGDFDPWFES